MTQFIVAALYKFTSLPDFETHQQPLQAACDAHNVMGTVLLASEGINGTISGSREGLDAVLHHIKTNIPGCADLDHKESWAEDKPFYRMKVRLKRESSPWGLKVSTPIKPSANMLTRKTGTM